MAKRRKEKDEEEDKPFKMPKFDEEAFLKRERRNIKVTFFSFLFGIIMAIVCFGFWVLMGPHDLRWELVLLVGVIYAAAIRYIFIRLNFDLTDFGRKNWFGSYAIYFISWLVIFIILVNSALLEFINPLKFTLEHLNQLYKPSSFKTHNSLSLSFIFKPPVYLII